MFYSLIIFIIVYLLLKFIASSSTKRLSKIVRIAIFIFSIILAIVFAFGGKFLLSLPLILLSLGVIKLKGLTLYQLIGLFRLIQTLRNSGRFSFNQNQNYSNSSILSLDEAYKILNLDPKKKYSKSEILNSYKKIMKKIHPDVSPELNRLASIVNEAKEIVIKSI